MKEDLKDLPVVLTGHNLTIETLTLGARKHLKFELSKEAIERIKTSK